MKVTVELDSTYFPDDQGFDEAVADKIQHKVVNSIWSNIKDEVEEQIEKIAKERVKAELSERIQKEAAVMAKTAKFKPSSYQYKGPDELTIEEYMQYMFSENSKVNIEEVLKERADKISKKLKDKYDLVFAQQVIMKMREQGLLKKNVESALFETNLKDESNGD